MTLPLKRDRWPAEYRELFEERAPACWDDDDEFAEDADEYDADEFPST